MPSNRVSVQTFYRVHVDLWGFSGNWGEVFADLGAAEWSHCSANHSAWVEFDSREDAEGLARLWRQLVPLAERSCRVPAWNECAENEYQ